MTRRVLPYEEWHRLGCTEASSVWPLLDPSQAEVIVVEQDATILGAIILMHVLHAECAYIDPAHRQKSAVGRQLMAGLRERVEAAHGHGGVWAAAITDTMRGLLEKHDAR